MIKKITVLTAICFLNLSLAQVKYEAGESFEFDPKHEKDAKIVLKDNYNHYLFSATNYSTENDIYIRKFDQKNHLVETFIKDFTKQDPATSRADIRFLSNYLGSFEI